MTSTRIRLAALAVAMTGLPAAAAEGPPDASKLLTPAVGTIFWTVLTFLSLLLLLRKVAWKPLLGAIEARERSIRDQIDQARSDREEAERLTAQQRELLAAARRERAEAVEQGKRDGERVRAEILDEARQQGERVLQESRAQVEAGLRRARGELRATAVDLAILAAEKLVSRNLDDPTQRRLVEEHLADLERRSGGSTALPS
jgi:F-type H+-transporting ATPase subunit b